MRIISARQPNLVVNTGDITLDGADLEDDLKFARGCHAALDVALRVVPGNHDVGDNPWQAEVEQPITEARLKQYRRHFGDNYWLVDAGDWVLVGVNAQLLGSGLAAEDEQWSFLASVPPTAGTRAVALFLHKPLFNEHPTEAEVNHRYVTPDNRRRLGEALRGAHLRLVASGHVHQHRHHRVDNVDHCWGPSTAFVLPERLQPRIGTKRVGYIDYTFRAGGVDIQVVEAPQLTNHDLDDFQRLTAVTGGAVIRPKPVLAGAGIVHFTDNPNHRRAKLVQLTSRGASLLQKVTRLQEKWANGIADGISVRELTAAVRVLEAVRRRLEQARRVPERSAGLRSAAAAAPPRPGPGATPDATRTDAGKARTGSRVPGRDVSPCRASATCSGSP